MSGLQNKKRSALEDLAGGVPKRPLTHPNLNQPPKMNPTTITYSSSIEEKENPLEASKSKMIEDTESLRYDTEQRVVANHEGFALLNEMRYLRENLDSKNEQRDAQSAQMQSQIESLLSQSADTISQLQTFKSERELDRSQIKNMESQIQDMDSQIHDLQSEISDLTHHRAALFAVRERGISTWVRDAFTKDTHRRKDRIASLNKEIIHAGDIWTDAVVVTKRFADKSTERREFVTLYGLNPEQVKSLDPYKCVESLRALNRAASILLGDGVGQGRKTFPNQATEDDRKKIVNFLLKGQYENAEEMSSTFL